jgi:hypothetical protein
MLHDLDKTLEKLLYKEIPRDRIDLSFEQPNSEWSARLGRPTLNMWCFDLRENVKLRTLDSKVTLDGRRGITKYAPRRIDLTYLVTAWAREVEDEHQLLWWALSILKRNLVLDPDECEGALRYQNHDIPFIVADVSDHPINMVDLWSVLDNQMRLGFIVIATIELDTQLEITSPLVLEARLQIGQSYHPEKREIDIQDVEIKHTGSLEEAEKRKNTK